MIDVVIVDVAFVLILKFFDFTHVVAPGAPVPVAGVGVDGTSQVAIWYSPPGFVVVLNGASWSSWSVVS